MGTTTLPQLISIPSFVNINITTFINRPVLSVVLLVYLIVYIIIGVVLFYHWRAYGMKSSSIVLAESTFVLVSLVLFALAAVSISYY